MLRQAFSCTSELVGSAMELQSTQSLGGGSVLSCITFGMDKVSVNATE
jgi:hypothetical protein